MTRIKQFTQTGNLKIDKKLFGYVGELCVNPSVHEELGVPVTSQKGDIWLVALDGGEVIGFAQARPMKTGPELHLRYVYAPKRATRESLLKAIGNTLNVRAIYTNARKTDTLWQKFGFKKLQGATRGGTEFVRWEKDVA